MWGDRIFVTCAIEGQDGVVCYDMQGKELWRKQLGAERAGKHRNGSGSNPSPVTDGEHVVVYFKSGTLASFSLDGKEQWKLNVQDKFGKDTLWWDLGTSPVIVNGRVIVATVQTDDAYSWRWMWTAGRRLGRQNDNTTFPRSAITSYSTPQVVNVGGKNVIVTWGPTT